MTTTTLIQLSPDDLQKTIAQAVADALKQIPPPPEPKLLLTVKEVADHTGYSTKTVFKFIHEGRKTRSGKEIRLPVVEITQGDFRVIRTDLVAWVSNF